MNSRRQKFTFEYTNNQIEYMYYISKVRVLNFKFSNMNIRRNVHTDRTLVYIHLKISYLQVKVKKMVLSLAIEKPDLCIYRLV